MDIKLSDRMSGLNPSAIREMFKVVQNPDIISFAAGSPSAAEFPVPELKAAALEIFDREAVPALQYGITEGYAPLRRRLTERLSEKFGIGRPFDDLIVVSGGQQCIDLSAKCLVNEGDAVLSENPSFIGGLNTFRSFGARLVGIPMDGDGMDTDALEEALKLEKKAKLIYTIPDFQNPMGVTMSLPRRRKVYELAVKYGVMVLEDAPYTELRYSGEPLPAIKSFDETGHVIYSGSMSKVIAPGIRIGFAVAQKDLMAKMIVAKQGEDVHTNQFFQILVDRYLEENDFDAHIKTCCGHYREKRDLMLRCMEENFPSGVAFTRPQGGIFLWCTLPEGYSGKEFCSFAVERGVAAVPGATFDTQSDPKNRCFRLNFTVPSHEQIKKGVGILGDCLRDYLK